MKRILSLFLTFLYFNSHATPVNNIPLAPHALAVAAKLLINRGKNEEAAVLVQKNLDLVQGPKDEYKIELNRLIDEKLVQKWLDKDSLQPIVNNVAPEPTVQTPMATVPVQQP